MSGVDVKGTTLVQVVTELCMAIRDSRIADVLSLVDPEVVCAPMFRPGLTEYEGHAGMTRLVTDLHAVHGNYQITIIEAAEDGAEHVTAQVRLVPEPGRGQPVSVTTSYTFRHGLISAIESQPAD
jgi:hypothetical protein